MRDSDLESHVREIFTIDVAEHRMIVAHDQGLYRHLIFQRREHSWNGRFELITAPGSLTISGDHGSFTFRRLTDMFQFFRGPLDRPHRINVGYWAEKLPDSGRSVQVYSEEIARQWINEHLRDTVEHRDAIQKELDEENARQLDEWREDLRAEGIAEGDPEWPAPEPERAEDWPELVKARELVEQATELIEDYDADGMLGYEDGARRLLQELEGIGLASDTFEWSLNDWDFHFVWCLNAIAWGIQQYDRAVRSGLHKIRTGPMPWDTPLPTAPPQPPTPEKPRPIMTEIKVLAYKPVAAAAVTGGVL
jgi:hypothetical protein